MTYSRTLIIILGCLTAFAPLSVDMYLPSMPLLGKIFEVNNSSIQLTLSVFLFGFAIGQIFYGPLSDKYGRKPIIIIGIIIYILSSIGAAIATDINLMIVMRFLQALGASSGPVLARTMVADIYKNDQAAKVLSILFLIMGSAPMLAPFIGAQLLYFSGWRSIFIFLTLFGILCLYLSIFKIPETHPKEKRTNKNLIFLILNYSIFFKNKKFIGFVILNSFSFASMFAYITSAPFIFIEFYKFSEQNFSIIFAINVIALMFGAIINTYLVKKVGINKMLFFGSLHSLIFGTILFSIIVLNIYDEYIIILLLFLFMPSVTIVGANSIAQGLNIYKDSKGSASSFMGSIQFLIGAFAGILVANININFLTSLCLIIFLCSCIIFLSNLFLTRD